MPLPAKAARPLALAPEVLAALQVAVRSLGTQRAVATDLGVSPAVINTLLKGSYRGDVPTMEARIRGRYMAETVLCPVMGQLGRDSCIGYQARPLAHTNPTRARLYAACKTCPNRKEP